jgi:hypothetical protein
MFSKIWYFAYIYDQFWTWNPTIGGVLQLEGRIVRFQHIWQNHMHLELGFEMNWECRRNHRDWEEISIAVLDKAFYAANWMCTSLGSLLPGDLFCVIDLSTVAVSWGLQYCPMSSHPAGLFDVGTKFCILLRRCLCMTLKRATYKNKKSHVFKVLYLLWLASWGNWSWNWIICWGALHPQQSKDVHSLEKLLQVNLDWIDSL